MDRRRMLAGLAGLPLAGIALPALAATPVDPLIAMHREAAGALARLSAGHDYGADGNADWATLSGCREGAFDMRATTLPGALASLEWARMEFVAHYIEPTMDGDTPDWLDRFTLNMLDSAIGALRQAVGKG